MPELKNDGKSAVIKKRAAVKKTAVKKTVTKKSTTKKSVAKKAVVRRAAGSAAQQNLFSQRDRYEMIAKMAYFRAEKRGFEPGREQDDWLECEKLVDGMLKNT